MTLTTPTPARLTMPANACPVAGCANPHPRYRIRCKPAGWKVAEVRVVCDQCWLAAGTDPRIEQLRPGPGEYEAAIGRVGAAPPSESKRRRVQVTPNQKTILAHMGTTGADWLTTATIHHATRLSRRRVYDTLLVLEERGRVERERKDLRGKAVRWRLAESAEPVPREGAQRAIVDLLASSGTLRTSDLLKRLPYRMTSIRRALARLSTVGLVDDLGGASHQRCADDRMWRVGGAS